jgi:hypothetical protein
MKEIVLKMKESKGTGTGTLAWTAEALEGLELEIGITKDGCLCIDHVCKNGGKIRICREFRRGQSLPTIGDVPKYDTIFYECTDGLSSWYNPANWTWGIATCYVQKYRINSNLPSLFGRCLTTASEQLVEKFLRSCADLLAAKVRERDEQESTELEGASVSVNIEI